MMNVLRILAACGAVLSTIATADAQSTDWGKIDGILGRTGAVGGQAHRYGFPRTDLQVTLDGVTIRPALALGGWVAFQPMGANMAMAMGDLVLLQSEVSPVMAKLLEGGLEVTALHNHLLRAEPLTFYMHVGGHGDPMKMAETIKNALAVSKTPLTTAPAGQPPAIDLDTAQIDQILGAKGANNGGVYAVNIPRRDPITEQGMAVGAPIMGGATAINFQPTGGGKAAITGDYAVIGSEVNEVVRALRANGIEVTAIHSHMLTEEPRIIFMHFWANDDAARQRSSRRARQDGKRA
jgi:Domain of Unknown Function (DUF1259)